MRVAEKLGFSEVERFEEYCAEQWFHLVTRAKTVAPRFRPGLLTMAARPEPMLARSGRLPTAREESAGAATWPCVANSELAAQRAEDRPGVSEEIWTVS